MTCRDVRPQLSPYLDQDVSPGQAGVIRGHLASCAACRAHLTSLQDAVEAVAALPRLECPTSVAARVLDRVDLERRKPSLAALARPRWAARPLILPSLVPAALVLATLAGALLGLSRGPGGGGASAVAWSAGATFGTEANPFVPSALVRSPRLRAVSEVPGGLHASGDESSVFAETVVAPDGSVSAVTLLEGEGVGARPVVEALRRERFEPGRFRGRAVAVSVYRLVSRMEVRAPRS